MPTSRVEIVPFVVNAVMQARPRSILEIGIGFGKYGMLFREYLEVMPSNDAAMLDPRNWKIRIVGIEVHPPYITEVQRLFYDMIILGDAAEQIDLINDDFDLIFLGDVIEHFPKEVGRALLEKCIRRARTVIVTTPNYFNPQGPEFGNVHETHHCLWTADDFRPYGSSVQLIEGRYICAVIRP